MIITESVTHYDLVNDVMTLSKWFTAPCKRTLPLPHYNDAYADRKTPTLEGFLQVQTSDRGCQIPAWTFGLTSLIFTYDCNSVLVRKESANRALQKYVPFPLCARIQYFSHYTTLAENGKEQCMYDTIRYHFFWPQIADDVFPTGKHCQSGTRDGLQMKHYRNLRLSQ